MNLWELIQTQLLGMAWLNRLTQTALEAAGVDTTGRLGGALQFFIYDSIKIMLLLWVLILMISYIQSYFPPQRSRSILRRFRGVWANIAAALLGTVTPFCSCSSIPLFIGFAGAGMPVGVAFSFLISSPMVDIASLMLLMGVFGWKIAAAYVLLGLTIAVAGGVLIGKMGVEDQLENIAAPCCCSGGSDSRPGRLKNAVRQACSTAGKLFPYVLLGVGTGAVIHNWIPERWISALLGGENPFGVALAVLVGAPMYADIFGVVPIAEALLAKGALPGVALALMMSVTTLSLPSLIMLRRAVRPKLLALFIAICIVGILAAGYACNALSPLLA